MLNVGDIVRLNSGGPAMTVGYAAEDGTVGVVWFAGAEMRGEEFKVEMLECLWRAGEEGKS